MSSDQTPPPHGDLLVRNLSFSKLNALAPEFVPMSVPEPRLVIAPPLPPPPHMIHMFPGPPTPFPIVPGPHMHHHPHHHQMHPHYHQNNHRHRHQKQRHYQGGENGHYEGVSEGHKEKENENSNGESRNGVSDAAAQKVINQVEYYFSDVNLATTDHLIRYINKDPEGFVPMSVIASFKKIKTLISSNSQLVALLRSSTKLVVSEDGKKVKRVLPLTSSDMEELQARIIVAENLPEDHCHQSLMKIFSAVGSVKSIRTCLPQYSNNGASSLSKPSKNDSIFHCNELHAFVEYESAELAEKAVAELNDEYDWRNGLRIHLLHKRRSKFAEAQVKKAGNEGEVRCEEDASTSEQSQNEKQSEYHFGQSAVHSHEHGGEHNLEKEGGQKKGRNRGRGKGRGRGHHNHQNNRGNHTGVPPINNAANGEQYVMAKMQQPPGPRMPDGTRGFSMGRGKPITVNTSC